jgi:predicted TIM-barrel fold metal-dependent hydrolase
MPLPTDGQLRIDCQSHILLAEVKELMERRNEPPCIYQKHGQQFLVVGNWHRPVVHKAADLAAKLEDMDRAGIQLAALSTNDPGPEHFGGEAPAIARIIHDCLADIAKGHPNRFFLLATLPLPLLQMEDALRELDRCVELLDFKGILLYSNIVGQFPDEPRFEPLFRRAVELDIPVLLHPPYPVTFEQTSGYTLTGGLGLMFDTTIALCRLILSGVFDRHPKLKLVCPHVGGTLPYLIGRIDHQVCTLKRMNLDLKFKPSDYLKNFVYLDTVNVLPEVIRFGYDMVGPDRLIFATDHPWVEADLGVQNLINLELPPGDQAKIFSGNAKQLFKLTS